MNMPKMSAFELRSRINFKLFIMKNYFKLFYALMVLVMLSSTSCVRDDVEDLNQIQSGLIFEPEPEEFYQFYKDVEFYSIDRNESGVMRVYADIENDLNDYNSNDFTLVKIFEGETLLEALDRIGYVNNQKEAIDANEISEQELEEDFKSPVAFKFISNSKCENCNYAVTFFYPSEGGLQNPESLSSRGGWKYYTHYSAAGQGLEESVDITRHSWWRRVYYGLRNKAYGSSGWSTIQNEWKKIKNNETVSYTRNPCYQYRARIKTKRNTAYSINFSD